MFDPYIKNHQHFFIYLIVIPPTYFVVVSDVKLEQTHIFRMVSSHEENIPTPLFYGGLGPPLMTSLPVQKKVDGS